MGLFSKLLGNAGVIDETELKKQYGHLLFEGEELDVGFKVIRDAFIFTNKRMILVDVQGVTGRKVEHLMVPYGKITKFSVENTGHLDLDAELKIWVGSEDEPISKTFSSDVNVFDVQKVLARYTC